MPRSAVQNQHTIDPTAESKQLGPLPARSDPKHEATARFGGVSK